jgi:ParB family chromosome partitioning protein
LAVEDEVKAKAPVKSRLGRGLSALIPTGSAATVGLPDAHLRGGKDLSDLSDVSDTSDSAARPVEIPLARITANPNQPRTLFDKAALAELAASIAAHGVLQPVLVRPLGPDRYELVSGERRLRAAGQAGLAAIPAIVRELTDEQSLVIALIENLQREDLNAIEAARGYRRLLDEFRLTQTELAVRIGKGQSTIANALRLLKLEPRIQESVASGQISEAHGMALITLADPERQIAAWERVVAHHLSVAQTRKAVLEAASGPRRVAPPPPPSRGKDIHWQALEDDLRAALGMKVGIVPGRDGRGTLVIEFADAEEIETLLERLQANR